MRRFNLVNVLVIFCVVFLFIFDLSCFNVVFNNLLRCFILRFRGMLFFVLLDILKKRLWISLNVILFGNIVWNLVRNKSIIYVYLIFLYVWRNSSVILMDWSSFFGFFFFIVLDNSMIRSSNVSFVV